MQRQQISVIGLAKRPVQVGVAKAEDRFVLPAPLAQTQLGKGHLSPIPSVEKQQISGQGNMIERIDLGAASEKQGAFRIAYIAIHGQGRIDMVGTGCVGGLDAGNNLGRLDAADHLVAIFSLLARQFTGFFHLLQPGLDDLDQIRFRDLIGRADDTQFRSKRRKCRTGEKQRENASQRPHEGRFWLGGTPLDF
jgi:hypothetical protein